MPVYACRWYFIDLTTQYGVPNVASAACDPDLAIVGAQCCLSAYDASPFQFPRILPASSFISPHFYFERWRRPAYAPHLAPSFSTRDKSCFVFPSEDGPRRHRRPSPSPSPSPLTTRQQPLSVPLNAAPFTSPPLLTTANQRPPPEPLRVPLPADSSIQPGPPPPSSLANSHNHNPNTLQAPPSPHPSPPATNPSLPHSHS